MRVITKRRIEEFIKRFAASRPSLVNWYVITRRATWRNLAELKADFSSADQVGRRTIFNISGNKYRLIARVNYEGQRVFVLHILTHKEYDDVAWN
ncbi:MAG: type II toxin-antitoxin system HigB family toxin [Bryobacteraceae bacterium]|nr:type II toxin-antitoxin system HigB family toxin [Bryobacteraceae bacterium]